MPQPEYNPGSPFTETQGYGNQAHGYHSGVDLAAPIGTGIPAASAGTVVYSGMNGGGYGNTVIIESVGADGQDYYTLYAHQNGQSMVSAGTQVEQAL